MIAPFFPYNYLQVLWSLDGVYRKQNSTATSTWRDIESRQQINTKTSTEIFVVPWMSVLDMALKIVLSFKAIPMELAIRIRAQVRPFEAMFRLAMTNQVLLKRKTPVTMWFCTMVRFVVCPRMSLQLIVRWKSPCTAFVMAWIVSRVITHVSSAKDINLKRSLN